MDRGKHSPAAVTLKPILLRNRSADCLTPRCSVGNGSIRHTSKTFRFFDQECRGRYLTGGPIISTHRCRMHSPVHDALLPGGSLPLRRGPASFLLGNHFPPFTASFLQSGNPRSLPRSRFFCLDPLFLNPLVRIRTGCLWGDPTLPPVIIFWDPLFLNHFVVEPETAECRSQGDTETLAARKTDGAGLWLPPLAS